MSAARLWGALAAWLVLGSATAPAHEGHEAAGSAPAAAAKAPKARAELGASAAFAADGALWSAWKQGEHVVVTRSADGGRSWSAPVRVNARPEAIAAEGEAWPKLALGPQGELYVSWTRPTPKPYTGEIRFSRSLDGGRSFSAPITVHTDRREITHRFDSLAVGATGRVFLAWIDKRDLEDAKAAGKPYTGAAVYVAMSDDRGASFRGDYKLADSSCECCRIGLLPTADGGLTALWRHVFAPNIRDHALGRMDGEGRTVAVRRATFDDWRLDACPHHGPSLAADGEGALHAVWFTLGPGREGVHYGRLSDGRVEGGRRVGGERAEHADLAASGQRLAIAWKEFDGRQTRLRAMTSADAGRSWREQAVAATAGPSDNPRVLTRDGQFHVFWNTRDHPLVLYSLEPPP